METGIDILRANIAKASPAQWTEGKAWYPAARDYCTILGRKHHLPVTIVAGVVAALSPRNRWYKNLEDASNVLTAIRHGTDPMLVKSGTFKTNLRKAADIALTGSTDPLKGRKVRSFVDNISFTDSMVVTVDVWARRAYGEEINQHTPSMPDKRYSEIEADYQILAAEYGVSPYVVQATAWVVIRGTGE